MYSLKRIMFHDNALNELKGSSHLLLGGEMSEMGSPETAADLDERIRDATQCRDSCDLGTDARSYYSGILRVLRRRKRENERMMGMQQSFEQPSVDADLLPENKNYENNVGNSIAAARMLKLAGI